MKSKSHNKLVADIFTYIVMCCSSIICIFPFIWMVMTSFKSTADAYRFPPVLLPKKWLFINYPNGWDTADFARFTGNTVFLASICTLGTVISAAVVAYGFAKFKTKGDHIWFSVLLGTLMLPAQVTLIPQYLVFNHINMVDTYLPLMIPAWLGGGAYNIFLYHQFFRTIPKEMSEAAQIDGANPFQILFRIMMPMLKPVSMAVGVMSLVYNWNNFLTPLIYLNTTTKYTISIGLRYLNSATGDTKIGQMMAVSVLTMIPVLIIFATCQKYFVEGIKMSGIKG